MKKILKKCLITILCLSAFTYAACGGKSDSDSESGNSITSESFISEIDFDSESFISESDSENSILSEIGTSEVMEEDVDVTTLVDFVVEVETGRDIRVLQLSDPQLIDYTQVREGDEVSSIYSPEKTEEYCYRYIRQVVERYDPDLIIVTGDIVYGKFDDNGSMLKEYVAFMETLETPWAPVFGNHDNESAMGADWQCQQFVEAENCLFEQRSLTGNGNYTVGLVQGDELKRVFFMMDSNGAAQMSLETISNAHSKREVGFGDDQIEWYKETATEIITKSPKTKLSFAFHIQLAAFYYALSEYTSYPLLEQGLEEAKVNLDENKEAAENGDFGYIGAPTKSAWDHFYEVFDSFTELGVDSVFVGHEHNNSASINVAGIRLQFGQKSSQYDRFNKVIDGGVIENNKVVGGKIIGGYNHEGTPIMGGTKITILEEDGSIGGDTGLILWQEDWGN